MNKTFPLKKLGLGIYAFIGTLILNSCYPDSDVYVEDLDVVATIPRKDYNFKQHKTYTLPTRIPIIKGEAPLPGDTLLAAVAQPILAEIRTQMANYGYTEIKPNNPTKPDVALTTAVFETTYVGGYYNYWWDYWGWWYWGYWGYPWGPGWYPGGVYYYTFDTGTLVMNISSPEATADHTTKTIWLGAVKGVLNGTTSNLPRAIDGIGQAYAQSPYLKVN
ncbi:DUF4136 domain-containing protein [Solitalea lacus]|uniref:DUF4136 domain-containing protein n=1 Tax=Solitalea lacus TaxID=2911172 RepID=UPI001EDC8D53|nr:DUF4136 domain-containing protein [Solitalea lacus]UKJ08620.1 DUF4136 domain-containing protein [Solitalea lacus]